MSTRPPLEVWEPTYRMKPNTNEMFIPVQVEAIIKDEVENKIREVSSQSSLSRRYANFNLPFSYDCPHVSPLFHSILSMMKQHAE